MITIIRLVMGSAMLALFALIFACATLPPQVPVQTSNAITANTGDTVQLFHGGSTLAKEKFCLNAVIPVYHYDERITVYTKPLVRNEVAKVKIVKDLGEFYVEAVVVEGNIKNGDIAEDSGMACLINIPELGKK